jgi:DNA end-binding protein Ku
MCPVPRSIWTGAISFGLVNVPVKLFSATSQKDVRFHQLEEGTGSRIRYKRVSEQTGEEVPYERIVKGYELGGDRYVVITPGELDALDPKANHAIDIEDFVELSEIDPIYYEHAYYLVPDKSGSKAYALLVQAMQEAGKVAIGRLVMRTKQYLCAIRPVDGVLCLETMLYADEVVPTSALDGVPAEAEEVSEREVAMARQLIESLSTEFEPAKYRDDYRERVLELIERKAEGQEIVAQPVAEAPSKVVDLMAALEASLAAAKEAKTKPSDDGAEEADDAKERQASSA